METEVLFTSSQVNEAIKAMVMQIREEFKREPSFLVVGIQSGGLNVAKRLKTAFERFGMRSIYLGSVDTTLYRDDINRLLPAKGLLPMEIPVSVEDMAILLVDDVIFTGRSVRAAMDALFFLGRPRKVRLAVLVDRGHRELPIQPEYVGFRVETDYNDKVNMSWKGLEGRVEIVHGYGSKK